MITWVIEGVLARSSRPGYPVKEGAHTSVAAWCNTAEKLGIKSILCLLNDQHLCLYTNLPDEGLLQTYQARDFKVGHVPVQDHKYPPISEAELEQIWTAFQKLPRPVLVHCSAGIDRTGAAVSFLLPKLTATP